MRDVHCPQCLGYRNNTVFAGIRIVYERALSMKTQKKILNIAMLGADVILGTKIWGR